MLCDVCPPRISRLPPLSRARKDHVCDWSECAESASVELSVPAAYGHPVVLDTPPIMSAVTFTEVYDTLAKCLDADSAERKFHELLCLMRVEPCLGLSGSRSDS